MGRHARGKGLGGADLDLCVVVDGPAVLCVVVTAAEMDDVGLVRSIEECQGAGLSDVAADLAGQSDGRTVKGDARLLLWEESLTRSLSVEHRSHAWLSVQLVLKRRVVDGNHRQVASSARVAAHRRLPR